MSGILLFRLPHVHTSVGGSALLIRTTRSPPIIPAVETLHPREAGIRALEAMEVEGVECGAEFVPLVAARTPEARQILREVARTIVGHVPTQLAMTDPARYRKRARFRTEIILRGYHDYFRRIADRD